MRFILTINFTNGDFEEYEYDTFEKALKVAQTFIGDESEEISIYDFEKEEYLWNWCIEELGV